MSLGDLLNLCREKHRMCPVPLKRKETAIVEDPSAYPISSRNSDAGSTPLTMRRSRARVQAT